MTTYPHWERTLLEAVNLPNTKQNRAFLSAWHKASLIDCALNPVDLTHREHGSTNCKRYSGPRNGNIHYQAYKDAASTRAAFKAQMGSGKYEHIVAALAYGNPYDTGHFNADDLTKIESDLVYWGSAAFGADYANEMSQGGPPPTLKAPQALKGWRSLQHAVNHAMPATLHASSKSRHAALRELSRARKVHL